MAGLLRPGTLVQVTPRRWRRDDRPYRAIVRGHDLFGTKYDLGREYLPGSYSEGGWWAFPAEVTEITTITKES